MLDFRFDPEKTFSKSDGDDSKNATPGGGREHQSVKWQDPNMSGTNPSVTDESSGGRNMFSKRAENVMAIYDIIEIIEDHEDFCVGIDAQGQAFRFEPAPIGSSIQVSWEEA